MLIGGDWLLIFVMQNIKSFPFIYIFDISFHKRLEYPCFVYEKLLKLAIMESSCFVQLLTFALMDIE